MCPEPVENELAGIAHGNDIAVDREGGVAGHGEGNAFVFDRCPSRARQAVLRRVRGLPGALAGEVGDEEIDVGLWLLLILVVPQEKITRAENGEFILLQRAIGSSPRPELFGKRFERESRGKYFVVRAGLQEDRGDGNQGGGEDEAQSGVSHG